MGSIPTQVLRFFFFSKKKKSRDLHTSAIVIALVLSKLLNLWLLKLLIVVGYYIL